MNKFITVGFDMNVNMEYAKELHKLVTLDFESQFPISGVIVSPEIINNGDAKVVRLGFLQRAIGIIEGVIVMYDEKTNKGEIDLDERLFPFMDTRHVSRKIPGLGKLIGQKKQFSFWPTWDIPLALTEESLQRKERPVPTGSGYMKKKKESLQRKESPDLSLPFLKIARMRSGLDAPVGHFEVVGCLTKISTGFFEVSIFSRGNKTYTVYLAGTFPEVELLGSFLRITGNFEAATGLLIADKVQKINFLPREDALRILSAGALKKTKNKTETVTADKTKAVITETVTADKAKSVTSETDAKQKKSVGLNKPQPIQPVKEITNYSEFVQQHFLDLPLMQRKAILDFLEGKGIKSDIVKTKLSFLTEHLGSEKIEKLLPKNMAVSSLKCEK